MKFEEWIANDTEGNTISLALEGLFLSTKSQFTNGIGTTLGSPNATFKASLKLNGNTLDEREVIMGSYDLRLRGTGPLLNGQKVHVEAEIWYTDENKYDCRIHTRASS